jgi:hypothetical protein
MTRVQYTYPKLAALQHASSNVHGSGCATANGNLEEQHLCLASFRPGKLQSTLRQGLLEPSETQV